MTSSTTLIPSWLISWISYWKEWLAEPFSRSFTFSTEFQDSCLDIIQGHNKTPIISLNPNAAETGVRLLKPSQAKTNTSHGRLDPALQHASHIAKPQLKFKHKPDNHRNYRWSPSLKHKYNAKVPLGYVSPDDQEESTSRVHVVLLPHLYPC